MATRETTPLAHRPSWSARRQMMLSTSYLSTLSDRGMRDSIEYDIVDWFARRSRAEFRRSLWADHARYGSAPTNSLHN